MKPKLYLETTIPSYLTSQKGRDIIQKARKQITVEWWETRLTDFNVFISQTVLEEAGAGDSRASARRLKAVEGFPLLQTTADVIRLAEILIEKGTIPKKSLRDALHIAVSTYHKMDYILSWNCKHIANGEIIRRLRGIVAKEGLELPVICTPDELLERS